MLTRSTSWVRMVASTKSAPTPRATRPRWQHMHSRTSLSASWQRARATGRISWRTLCGSNLHPILPSSRHDAFLELMVCSIWALLIAITTISLLMTSGGRMSMASSKVSNHALATTWKVEIVDTQLSDHFKCNLLPFVGVFFLQTTLIFYSIEKRLLMTNISES